MIHSSLDNTHTTNTSAGFLKQRRGPADGTKSYFDSGTCGPLGAGAEPGAAGPPP
jgi:hypothetical protein